MRTFERDGVSVRYPDTWAVDVDAADDGWAVALTSPHTAFALVSLRPDAGGRQQAADEALDALRAEYPQLDAAAAAGTLAGRPAVGYDVDFLTLDTAVVAWLRAADTPAGPLVVLSQVSEYDRGRHEPVLKAIAASVAVADD